MMKKGIALLLTVLLLCPAVSALGVSARLKREMATRSGPGTWYTEELGTWPASTSVIAIEQITTSETTWVLVEFRDGGNLYRAYTGLWRLETYGEVPLASVKGYNDTVIEDTVAYYGPGTQYAARHARVPNGTSVVVYDMEGSWAQCEYRENGTMVRGYIAASALDYTRGTVNANPATAAPALIGSGYYWGSPSVVNPGTNTNIGVDYYGNPYDYTGCTEEFAKLVRSLPVMRYFEGIPCVQRSDVYAGPGAQYWRPRTNSGYAYTGTSDTNLRIYGQENGWLLIRYPTQTGYRYGWTSTSAIPSNVLYWASEWERVAVQVLTTAPTYAYDDPDTPGAQGMSVPQGIYMTALAFLDENRAWVYCEYTVQDGGAYYQCRGFIPSDALKTLYN